MKNCKQGLTVLKATKKRGDRQRMENAIKRKIEYAFYNYNKLKESSEQALDDIRNSGITIDFGTVQVSEIQPNKKQSGAWKKTMRCGVQ